MYILEIYKYIQKTVIFVFYLSYEVNIGCYFRFHESKMIILLNLFSMILRNILNYRHLFYFTESTCFKVYSQTFLRRIPDFLFNV